MTGFLIGGFIGLYVFFYRKYEFCYTIVDLYNGKVMDNHGNIDKIYGGIYFDYDTGELLTGHAHDLKLNDKLYLRTSLIHFLIVGLPVDCALYVKRKQDTTTPTTVNKEINTQC
jgi:hypothetical protein